VRTAQKLENLTCASVSQRRRLLDVRQR